MKIFILFATLVATLQAVAAPTPGIRRETELVKCDRTYDYPGYVGNIFFSNYTEEFIKIYPGRTRGTVSIDRGLDDRNAIEGIYRFKLWEARAALVNNSFTLKASDSKNDLVIMKVAQVHQRVGEELYRYNGLLKFEGNQWTCDINEKEMKKYGY